jgi:hypothetical protein
VAPEPRWEPLFRRTILNHASAAAYRTWLPLRAEEQRQGFGAGARGEVQEWRVAVDTTGVYRLGFDALQAAGISTPTLDWGDLRLEVRDFDDHAPDDPFRVIPIPFLPEDADGDALFESGETLVFLGEDAGSFFALSAGDRRYGLRNVYWLVAGAGPGATMEPRPAWQDWTGLTPRSSYDRTLRFEEDLHYTEITVIDDVRSAVPGPYAIRTDHYNWTFPRASELLGTKPIKVVSFDLPQLIQGPSAITRLRLHLQGQHYISSTDYSPHRPRLWLSRSAAASDTASTTAWAFPGNPYVIDPLDDLTDTVDNPGLAANLAGTGRNYLKIYLPTLGDGADNRNGDQVGIDWLEVSFRGPFDVRNHRLQAPLTGLTGRQQVLVRRLPSADVRVLDVGDRRAPVELEVPDSLLAWKESSNSYELRLQIDCGDGSQTREILVIEGGVYDALPARAVSRRRTEDLTRFDGEDLVVAYPRRFEAELAPLLAHRESQGHRILRAPMDAVYDAYSGGRAHPFALKRLLRRMWQSPPAAPDYLLLAGDASTELAGNSLGLTSLQSDSAYVPTITLPGHGFGGVTEVVACDPWFVDNLSGVMDDPMSYFADLHVGRISCGSPEELRTYVEKVLAYETQDLDGDWRTRLAMLADDDYSNQIGGLGGGEGYKKQGSERFFLSITRNATDTVLQDTLFSRFAVDSIYLNAIMDSVVTLGRCVPDPLDPARCQRDGQGRIVYVDATQRIDFETNRAYGEDVVKDLLLGALARGALYWAFQGHSNRTQLTHEEVFRNSWRAGILDVERLANVGKPFIFGGYGCHLSDFASHFEGDPGRRDAMVEAMLFCCEGARRGAIGVIGSTDFEQIGHNYEEKVSAALFDDPPADESGRRRWRLGEVYTQSKAKLDARRLERLTYTLLGDPALRLGVTPPRLQLVLNGWAWEPDVSGDYASDRDDDSLALRIRLSDESSVDLPQVWDLTDQAVPPESLRVIRQDRQGRILEVLYRTRVERRPYRLKVRAVDYEGTAREAEVRVPFAVQLFEQVRDELEPLIPGDNLRVDARLALTLRCGAHLAREDVRLFADDDTVEVVDVASPPAAPHAPFDWTFRFGALPVPDGTEVELRAEVRQRDGAWLELARVPVVIGEVRLRIDRTRTWWLPNPFAGESHLSYRLTDSASRTRLRIYTVAGRLIRDDSTLDTNKGLRRYRWDGRDGDGHEVANGLYFYELSVWDAEGRRADRLIDKLVRAR